MSKQLQSSFLSQWLLIQVFGSIALAIATQAIVSLTTLLFQVDSLMMICLLRLLAYLLSTAIQGYLQWHFLKQTIASLDRQWIFTAVVGLPIDILTWRLIHLGTQTLVFDEDGTALIILAIVGGIMGGINGRMIGNWQKYLLQQRLHWRSLWYDWDREQLLAGVLGGVVKTVIIIGSVFLFEGDWMASPLIAFICTISLAASSQVMYGAIVGDTIYDVFKQAKLFK